MDKVVDVRETYKAIIIQFGIDLDVEDNTEMFEKLVTTYSDEAIITFATMAHVPVIYKQ